MEKVSSDHLHFQPQPALSAGSPPAGSRWSWARRFVVSLIAFTIVMHCLPKAQVQLFARNTDTPKEEHIVLHTGFPPIDRPAGQPIVTSGSSAAVAFSPQPATQMFTSGESWWDRIFPKNHVHLKSVQLALLQATATTHAKLSVCSSTHDRLWQSVPDSLHCIASAEIQVEPLDDDVFGILDWTPQDTIVLQRRQVYWLVVEAVDVPFQWAFAQSGVNQYGSALETSAGWQLQAQDDPIPSVMVSVAEH